MPPLKAELQKFINRPWVFIILLLLPINLVFFGLYEYGQDEDPNSNWKQELNIENQSIIKEISELEEDESYGEFLKSKVERNKLYIDNNISPYKKDNWSFAIETEFFNLLLMLLIVGISCVTFSMERSLGTYSNLLLNGYKPIQIASWKLLSLFGLLLTSSILLLAIRVIVGGILLGFTNPFTSIYIYESAGDLISINAATYLGITSLSFIVETTVLILLSCLVSVFFKNWIWPMGIVLITTGFASTILVFISEHPIVKLSIFSNMNLSAFLLGGERLIIGYSIYSAILVISIHLVLFVVLIFYKTQKSQHVH